MTTIGNYAVDLTLNASGLFKNAELARGEFSMLGSAANRLRTDFEKESFILARMEAGVESLAHKTDVHNEVLRRQRELVESLRPKTEEQINQIRREQEERARLTQQEKEAAKNRESLMTPQERHAGRRAELYEQFRRNLLLRSQYDALVKLSAAERDKEMVDKNAIATQEKLNSVINKHRTELQRLKADLALLMTAQKGLIGSDQQLANAISNVSAKIKEEEDRLSKLNSKTSETSGIVSGLTNRFAGFMAAKFTVSGIANLASQAEQANIKLKQTEAILQAISGSDLQGTGLLKQIRELTKTMPIGFQDAAEAAKNMLAYGFSANEIIPAIRQIGTITAGNSERFKNLTNAVAQMRGSMRLMGQEVIQAVNAGWNPLSQISIDTGKSISILKKEMEEGKISFDMVSKALENATSSTGRFGTMNEKVMATIAGQSAVASAKYEEALARMGEAIEPISLSWKKFTVALMDEAIPAIEATGTAIDRALGTGQKGNASESAIAKWFMTVPKWVSDEMDRHSKDTFFYKQLAAANREVASLEHQVAIASRTMEPWSEQTFIDLNNQLIAAQKNLQALKEPGIFDNLSLSAAEALSTNEKLMHVVERMRQDQFSAGYLSQTELKAFEIYAARRNEQKLKEDKLAEEALQKEKERNAVTAAEVKAQEAIDDKYQKTIEKLQVKLTQLQEGDAAAAAMKADLAGMNDLQIQEIECLATQVEFEENKLKLKKEQIKEEERALDLVAKYAKKTDTIAEKTGKDFVALEGLLNAGKISFDQFFETRDRLLASAAEQQFGQDKQGIGGPPKAIVSGSAEAINAVLGKMREPVAVQMKQLKEQENQSKLLKDIETAIKNQDTVEAKR